MSDYTDAVLGDSPVSYWRLNETTGTVAADQMGLNPGTYSAPAAGRTAPSLINSDDDLATLFPSQWPSDSWVNVPDSPSLSITGAISVELWVETEEQSCCLVEKTKNVEGVIADRGYEINMLSGQLRWVIGNGTVAVPCVAADDHLLAPWAAGAWNHHVVGTWDGTTNPDNMRLYVDGEVRATATYTATSIKDRTEALRIGSTKGLSSIRELMAFVGTLDEVAIYNYCLTASQVQAHYDAAGQLPQIGRL